MHLLKIGDSASKLIIVSLLRVLLTYGNTNVFFLFAFQYGDTPLHTAARYGHAGVTRILVSARCAVNEQNKVGGH